MSNLAIAAPTRARANVQARKITVHEHDDVDYDQSLAWTDFKDEWVEQRMGVILDDHERDLSDVIGDYCESPNGTACGLPLNHWQDYERAIRAAMDESPCFRDFMEKAAMWQAERDFGDMVKGC